MVEGLFGGLAGTTMKSDHRPRRRSRFVTTAALMSLFFVCEASATTYYVDKATGSDSRAGTSTSTAWATIGKANATLRAGDTVYVRAGTYDEIIEPYQSGAAGAPITYQKYQGETVTVRGEIGKYCHRRHRRRRSTAPADAKSYIVVDGFTLRHIDPFHRRGAHGRC